MAKEEPKLIKFTVDAVEHRLIRVAGALDGKCLAAFARAAVLDHARRVASETMPPMLDTVRENKK